MYTEKKYFTMEQDHTVEEKTAKELEALVNKKLKELNSGIYKTRRSYYFPGPDQYICIITTIH